MTPMGWFGLALIVGGILAMCGPVKDENGDYHRDWDPD